MNTSPVKILNQKQYQGLQKLGDSFIPGDLELPRFSKLGCAEHVDTPLEEMSSNDLKDLKLLLTVLSFLPNIIIVLFLYSLELFYRLPGPLSGQIRFIRMGIKGLVVSLYYSGKSGKSYQGKGIHEIIGYSASVYTGDLDQSNHNFDHNHGKSSQF